jgi:ppGpp synthetase/RelA/SpoT-type nucleotidyltranferase
LESDIDSVISRLFPEDLVDPDVFDDWSSQIRQDAQPGAADLVVRLEQELECAKEQYVAQCGLQRDCWELFGGEGDKTIKSARSIRSKLARGFLDEKITACKKTKEALRSAILEFSDLGRVRIVADFPSDIASLEQRLFNAGVFLGHYQCPKGIKDFVFDPTMRNGLKGHRARQFSVRVPLDDKTCFGFEVQLMTRLQHVWDRRNHPLYEWQRETLSWMNESDAVELAVDDFACAEALHLVDRQADQNWKRLQALLGKR